MRDRNARLDELRQSMASRKIARVWQKRRQAALKIQQFVKGIRQRRIAQLQLARLRVREIELSRSSDSS